jgi:hypothetical protein
VLEQNANSSCYGREMLRYERVFRSNHRGTRARRLPCEGFRPNEPKRDLAGHVRRLGSVTRLSVEKFPVFFLLFTGRPILLPAAVACYAPALKKTPSRKSGRFWRNEPDSYANPIHADSAERTQADWRRPARWQDELEPRHRAHGISAIVEGCATIIFAIFRKRSQSPQTKPTSKRQTKQRSKMNNTRLDRLRCEV